MSQTALVPTAGDLRDRVAFYAPVSTDDGFGNVQIGFSADQNFTVAAGLRAKLGGEQVLAGRLTGRNLVNVVVRSSADTRIVTEAWKARDVNAGVDYNIRSIVDPFSGTPQRGRFLEMLCEKGVAI